MNNIPEMLTVEETYRRCKENNIGVSKNFIRQLGKQGKITCIRVGERKLLLNWDSLVDYLNTPQTVALESPPRIRAISERFSA